MRRSLVSSREKVAAFARRMWELGLVAGSYGNISLRIGGLVVITPSKVPYDVLRPRMVPVIDLEGRVVDGISPPSTEWRLHLAVYRRRPDVGAVVHTHSPYATAAATSLRELPLLADEGRGSFGEAIPVASYAPPGTPELAEAAVDALGEGKAVLLARHGALAVGRTLREAFLLAQMVEEIARVYFLTTGGGR